ncbi:LysR family transcriptional regulator [Jiella avicenniae]|nr:LysR family transcriptional regulator [Jiella avicenniae]
MSYFVAMYEEASVTRAAERLNIVQPAVSVQLARLEESIGQKLFYRTPKGMVPTHAGDDAYRRFQPILREVEQARRALTIGGDTVKGHVSLGAVSSVANNALSETLRIFHGRYPEVTLRATGGYTTDLIEMLRTAQLDLVIVNTPSRGGRGFDTLPIINEDLALICDIAHPPLPATLHPREAAERDLVIPSQRHGLRLIIDAAFSAHDATLAPRFEFDELKTIEEFLPDSGFATILPPIAVHRALRTGRLRMHPIVPSVPRRLVCLSNTARPLSRAAELFVEELRERMIEVSSDLTKAIGATP